MNLNKEEKTYIQHIVDEHNKKAYSQMSEASLQKELAELIAKKKKAETTLVKIRTFSGDFVKTRIEILDNLRDYNSRISLIETELNKRNFEVLPIE